MLRAFKGEPGMMDSVALRGTAMAAIKFAVLAAGMYALCRAQTVMGLAPLALALLAAIMTCRTGAMGPAGLNCGALLVGCLVGAWNGSISDFNLLLPVGAAIVMALSLAWDFFGQTCKTSESAGMVFRGLAAGFGVLAPGLIQGRGDLLPSLQVLGAALCAGASAPFIHSALSMRLSRRFLTPEERIGLMIPLLGVIGGLASIYMPAAAAAATISILILHPAGALAGGLTGGAILLFGGEKGLFIMLCMGGLAAQMLTRAQKYNRAGLTCLAMLLSALWLGGNPGPVVGCCIAAGTVIIMPEKWTNPFTAWARPAQSACDPDRLARLLRRQAVEKLTALSGAFGELAEGYLIPGRPPDEQTLIAGMRLRLCGGCPGYENCWAGSSNLGAHFLCSLIAGAVEWAAGASEGPLFEPETPPDVLRRCRRGRMIPERLSDMLEDFACARRAELKRGAENRLISAQFLQAKQLLDGLAESQSKPIRLRDRQAARAASVLEKAGIPVGDVMVLSSPRAEIIASLSDGRWNREMAEVAKVRFSRAFGRAYLPEGDYGREMRFVRRPRFRAATGAGCVSREAGIPSGDSHIIRMLDDERLLMLICDGMGSGEAAARESAAAVRLLAKFIAAGVDCPLAIETVNALLLNRSGEDMFATVDMLILDLTSGMGEFVKLAACPTLIARGGEILRVEGGRLPLGILERVQPAISQVQLLPGDIVFMASDGVMDAADPDLLMDALVSAPNSMPELTRRALAIAGNEANAWRRDDMTALALRVG